MRAVIPGGFRRCFPFGSNFLNMKELHMPHGQNKLAAGWTQAEIDKANTLYATAQAIQNTGAETFYAMSARNAAAAEAYRAHLNAIGQRLYAAPGPHDDGMGY
jgi:aspartate aminotransferase-like enzyme